MRVHVHTSLLVLGSWLGCTVDNTGDASFGDVTGQGTDVSSPMRETADSSGDGPDATTVGSSFTTAGSSEGADAECPVGRACMTAVPDDWFGPVAVHMGDPDAEGPECPETYPNSGLSLMSGYADPGPAQCECECTLDMASACYSYAYDMDAGCSSYESFYMITMDCQPVPIDGGVYFYSFLQGNATCTPEVTETIPEPLWDAKVTSCRDPEEGTECSAGVCTLTAPDEFEAGLCIYREGAHECPEGDYSVKYTHHSGVEDTRNCSYCGCGTGSATCMGDLQVYTSNDCTGASQSAALNVCTPGISGGQSVSIAFANGGSCPIAAPPEPTGEIAVTGEFTYCCTQ